MNDIKEVKEIKEIKEKFFNLINFITYPAPRPFFLSNSTQRPVLNGLFLILEEQICA